MARFERSAISPGQMTALNRMWMENDVRHLLPSIQVPTLVLHVVGDRVVRLAHGRYLAEHIPAARLVELPGGGAAPTTEPAEMDRWVGEIEEFLTGFRSRPDLDRVL